ncbi:MAG: SpoIVB peptidase S55 domain-containing protein [bacterium]
MIRKIISLLFLGFFLLPASLALAADGDSLSSGPLDLQFMPTSEIRPGMVGYGLTVFEGTRIERFQADILGVDKNAFAKGDMIVARLSGGPLSQMGVIAGMSGSPVYINDRLIGAVAYGWSFAKTPIAGITPIENMLKVYDRTNFDPHNMDAPGGGFAGSAAPVIQLPLDFASQHGLPVPTTGNAGTFELRPLSVPLLISPTHPKIFQKISERLASFGLEAIEAPLGGAGDSSGAYPPMGANDMVGGAGLGVPMIRGDMSWAGIGTVTYRRGDKIVGFGHPMFGEGDVETPMAPAVIHGIMESYARPFKLGSVLEPVGSLRQDRQFAVGGVFGLYAPSAPLKVVISQPEVHRTDSYQFDIWHDQNLLPMLMEACVWESLFSSDKYMGKSSARYHYRLTFENHPPLEARGFVSSEYFLPFEITGDFYAALSRLMQNEFGKVRVTGGFFEIDLRSQYREARLLTLETDRSVYKPGETVKLEVQLQPYRGEYEKMTASMALPQDLGDGQYELAVVAGSGRQMESYQRAPGLYQPHNLDQLFRILSETYPENRVYFLLKERDRGLTLYGEELPSLPGSVRGTIQRSEPRSFVQGTQSMILLEQSKDTDYQMAGRVSATIRVDRRGRR